MSNVYDAQGNLVNNPGPGTQRYKDANATEIDWFDTHPRPVEAKTEFQVTKIPATLPPNSGDTLKVVEAIEIAKTEIRLAGLPEPNIDVTIPATIGEFADRDAAQGVAIDHSVKTGEPLFAGNTTSNLPQTAVTE